MGGNNSKQQNTKSAETTVISNNQNSTIHFDNIYQLHENHTQHISELQQEVKFGLYSIFTLIALIVVGVLIYFLIKKLSRSYKYHINQKIDNKAKTLALEMIEKGIKNNP